MIVQKTYTPVNNLYQTANTLEANLNKKERYVFKVINDQEAFNQLKSRPDDYQNALNLIQNLTTDKNTRLITLAGGHLNFWSDNEIIPEYPASIKEGSSFIKDANGYYEAIKKTVGNFSAIFFIPVKQNYSYQNQYLQNTFSTDLISDNTNIELADFTDKRVYNIYTVNKTYLFSVKIKPGKVNRRSFYFEFTIWILTLITLCILVHNICNYFVLKGSILLSLIALGAFIIILRFINIHYNWPDFSFRLDIFNPSFYSSGPVNLSLGDLCLNILLTTWFIVFLFRQRQKLIKNVPNKIPGYLILTTGLIIVFTVSTVLLNLFYGLIVKSEISLDVSNILNLSLFSLLVILILSFISLNIYLLIEVFLTTSYKLNIPDFTKILIHIAGIILATIITAYYRQFSLLYVLLGLILLIRAFAYMYNNGRLNARSFAIIILLFALISSIKLNYYQTVKENEIRKVLIKKLEVPDDVYADVIFNKIEKQIIADTAIVNYVNHNYHNINTVKSRLQKLYLNGYLSRYQLKVYEFDRYDRPLSFDTTFKLSDFKNKVLYNSFKVSNYFYRENNSFGFQVYFALLPVIQQSKTIKTILIELKSKPFQLLNSFPGLLIDGKINTADLFKGYSYAYYINNRLLSQSGSYVYNQVNTDLQGPLKAFTFKTSKSNSQEWYSQFKIYSHLIYKSANSNLIVISKEKNLLAFGLTSITFFFVAFLIFSVIVILVRWLWLRVKIIVVKNHRIKLNFKLNFDRILYKTRIQFSMFFTVVVTLLVVGFITFYSIRSQYQKQQENIVHEKIVKISAAFQNWFSEKFLSNNNDKNKIDFTDFANTYATDLTLFDLTGEELMTTQPKIYEFGLQARRMNARAYIYLSKLQRSEYINDEFIGKFSYKAAYMPVLNAENKAIAYLQLPYFSNEADYKEHIGSLLNIMINVYVLVFISIGLLAVMIARRITAPLNIIQYSLSKTIYGKKNEPITWERNDEIGALVKEYNKMIAELEGSAKKLAQSERESAWREMAKQVAHEIKNPLTPLKLGLQLLDKSWREKDPKFDQKFERFSKSFVEQIESLSSIASEFSAFAKMPDTRIEKVSLFDMLSQAVIIFKQLDNIVIFYQAPEVPFFVNADRDQLLRCYNNLLKNAIEAVPIDRKGLIEINYLITSKSILLTIKDNGNGIPESLREKIFEPNFTTKSSGTGLGLAFVKNSITNAGGSVWFETVMGEGTTFYFSLPSA